MNGDTEALTEKLWDAVTEIRDDFPRSHRDAAREALDGLAEHANRTANERRSPQAVNRWDDIWRETRKYRDTHYPEEIP